MTLRPIRRRKPRRTPGWIAPVLMVPQLVPTIWFAQHQIRSRFANPKLALVLGGDPSREDFAAEFARTHPDVKVWISSGSNPEYAEWVFGEANIPRNRWRLDYQAVDTVTNFTTLVNDMKKENIDSIYLITSDYHMRRASLIAQIVLGSQGIHFKPVMVPSAQPEEDVVRAIRDGARAAFWLFTGKTGSGMRDEMHQLLGKR